MHKELRKDYDLLKAKNRKRRIEHQIQMSNSQHQYNFNSEKIEKRLNKFIPTRNK
ncbi:hypothetical protein Q7181_001103 [Enterococcus faecalis]|uniref:hypothetical protein n=1 Tax=Enterococcus faecalis TaxID=1351 RepID=UPI000DFFF6AB|nr:hypothetical protein [Enterococcus faecalis]EGS7979328.1 hypothetical protein [Enterococcus faecalis]EIR9756250.1 hypothetical protein [Enterococcus faecalis]EIW2179372.1 hypothetical protein [Enterococcus faecalis]EJG4537762.1 hypothetical protein [Enterococcus faecalis]EJH6400259.1 hypothetical protein [Enterococcus faecalis]